MTSTDDAAITVTDNPEQHRFEIHAGGVLAGFTEYRVREDRYSFVHTEIGDEFGGRGLASWLIKDALDEMRTRGAAVLPYCPFVKRFIQRHAEYQDLVPAAERAAFDIPQG
ncbi:GNAT family N-acetyltransferase [Nakamurella multipartita]|jgi:predicted GNAT family acetyltransferase|uniref:Acetyltransferase-like protein n=1 Tax=Nakamurella multipartita (strain ATCC 700099 / DSM 44233 / CIP 104796 / JCM 9543 / NBRC 105858 / Y-104) TaxID=479431 RepID=C8X8U0_NAKMY|nr:GNAT family N-acetyltransferase [Nakamurella multipartita]ACV81038.1 acetyltransferase-like protein [Nakamurella multipartita DSM 44233]